MMRHPMLALVGALVLALVGPSVAAQEATPTSGASVLVGAITDMRYLLPFTPDGLNPRLHATATEDGICADPSDQALDRPDAWNCVGANDQIYDPCFENPYIPPPAGVGRLRRFTVQPGGRRPPIDATGGAAQGGPGPRRRGRRSRAPRWRIGLDGGRRQSLQH